MFHASRLTGSGLFATFFDALPIEDAKRHAATAKFLGCTERTLRNWLSGKRTPPPSAVAALFHETHYGLSATSSHSENGAQLALQSARIAQEQVAQLEATVTALQQELDAV